MAPGLNPQLLPSPLCSVHHQAAADRRQELEEALEGDRPSGWAGQGGAGWGARQRWGQAVAPCWVTRTASWQAATRREQDRVAIVTYH